MEMQNMLNPLISIIIPTLNEGEFIEKVVGSILAQDYRPLEIIIVDGGSKDDTIKKAEKIFMAYLHTSMSENGDKLSCQKANDDSLNIKIFHEKDFGDIKSPANARNIGINTSKGYYVILLDSDIFFIEKDSIEKIKLKLDESEFTKVKIKIIIDTELELQLSLGGEHYHHCGYREKIFERAMFNPYLGFGEDTDFWYRSKIDQNIVCDTTLGRHLPHTKKEYKSQLLWYGRTYLDFMINTIKEKEWSLFRKESFRMASSVFLLMPLLSLILTLYNVKIALFPLTFLCILHVRQYIMEKNKSIGRFKFLFWNSYFSSYWFIYGILISAFRLANKCRGRE